MCACCRVEVRRSNSNGTNVLQASTGTSPRRGSVEVRETTVRQTDRTIDWRSERRGSRLSSTRHGAIEQTSAEFSRQNAARYWYVLILVPTSLAGLCFAGFPPHPLVSLVWTGRSQAQVQDDFETMIATLLQCKCNPEHAGIET